MTRATRKSRVVRPIQLSPANAFMHPAAFVTTRSPTFKVLIAAELARIEAQIVNTPHGPERDKLDRKLHRFRTAFNVDSWVCPIDLNRLNSKCQ